MPVKKPIFLWQYDTAAQYANAAGVLNESMARTASIDLVLPVVMCQLLSIELLLKSMLLAKRQDIATEDDLRKAGINIRGHDLKSLYERLGAEVTALINEHFFKCRTARMSTMSFADLLKEIGAHPFVDWRYFYERGSAMQLRRDALEVILESIGKAANDYLHK
jgi:hypothetical protein